MKLRLPSRGYKARPTKVEPARSARSPTHWITIPPIHLWSRCSSGSRRTPQVDQHPSRRPSLVRGTPGSAEWRELMPLHDGLDDGPGGGFGVGPSRIPLWPGACELRVPKSADERYTDGRTHTWASAELVRIAWRREAAASQNDDALVRGKSCHAVRFRRQP